MTAAVYQITDLTIREAKRRQDSTVQGHAISVPLVGCNAEKDSFLLDSGNRSFSQAHGTFEDRLGLDNAR